MCGRYVSPTERAIHGRMPVILAPEQFKLWPSPRTSADRVQLAIADARDDFTGHAMTTQVNDVRNDDEGLIERVD
ncbi:hypothetical protein [Pseudomonas sp. TCU-HL1]|uniref:hypothetical protein n=1 Tax=Pseudomonas sp. TCU-HL1 TaxID=1856685 RepID=UPI00083E0BA9|nr:hypothetical protein [Pseudomonas sp. TCU-HL1]AOE86989.1 hypothetical protein THL1_4441 [Pseudomonas sp. TCU-HL1]